MPECSDWDNKLRRRSSKLSTIPKWNFRELHVFISPPNCCEGVPEVFEVFIPVVWVTGFGILCCRVATVWYTCVVWSVWSVSCMKAPQNHTLCMAVYIEHCNCVRKVTSCLLAGMAAHQFNFKYYCIQYCFTRLGIDPCTANTGDKYSFWDNGITPRY